MKTITHNLKTDSAVFCLSWAEKKPFEIRYDDRCFEVGDELVLFETKFSGEEMRNEGKPLEYTGRRIRQKITSKVKNYGLLPDWCVLGVTELHRESSPVTWEVKKTS